MKNWQPLVSVIMPTYNRANIITRAIDSFLNQTYKNIELLLIDDCSTDETFEVISPYLKRELKIRYYKLEKNSGACIARNKGLELAKGDFLTFLDSDDEYCPQKIAKQVNLFKTSKVVNLGVVSCGRMDIDSKGKIYNTKIPKFKGNVLKPLLSKKHVGAGTPFLMISKDVKLKGIKFDPNMPAGQDYDFLVRISMHYNFDLVPEPLVKVYHHKEERVYTHQTALVAFELQYQKYRNLIKIHGSHEKFVLKHADLYFVYGHRDKAIQLLNRRLPFSIKKLFWQGYFQIFKQYGSWSSKAALKVLRTLHFK